MKMDVVLTMNEYLKACRAARLVRPPARDARHIPITLENFVEAHPKEHACRCDRWGHPCPDCAENKK